VVARVDFRSCRVLAGEALIEAAAHPRLLGRSKRLGNRVVVGDHVRLSRERGRPRVMEVEPRRNHFSRRAPGIRPEEQVVAANLDQVVLVASVAEPAFKPGLADRVSCEATREGIPMMLVLNKIDLGGREEAAHVIAGYDDAGCAGRLVSARTGEGVDALREACRGKRSLFVGHSGVGKSRLLNALVPGLDLLVGQVNPRTGKGRHTTTAAWLVRPEPGLELIDTPGMRAFALWGIEPRDLDRCFLEFRELIGRCRFADCGHDAEPGCAIRAAVETGHVSAARFQSFHKLRNELARERGGP
jgi:ribosome biogenesis GTPase